MFPGLSAVLFEITGIGPVHSVCRTIFKESLLLVGNRIAGKVCLADIKTDSEGTPVS